MRFERIGCSIEAPARARGRAGFTFAEILISMLLVAVIIPVAVKGLRLASDAGTLAERKMNALHLGEAMLNQLVVTRQWQSGSRNGIFPEPWHDYDWEISTRTWEGTELTELSMRVIFPIRGHRDFVEFSTLVDSMQQ